MYTCIQTYTHTPTDLMLMLVFELQPIHHMLQRRVTGGNRALTGSSSSSIGAVTLVGHVVDALLQKLDLSLIKCNHVLNVQDSRQTQ